MATATLKRDVKKFSTKNTWFVEKKTDLLCKYIASRPQNVDLTDEEIMEEVKAVR